MPQSLAQINIHLIFSTKNRISLLDDEVRDPLHRYMAVVLQNLGCPSDTINSVEDHVHILFDLGRTTTVADAVEEVKKASSKWIKTQSDRFANFFWQRGYGAQSDRFANFFWQGGYGAFAVSESNVSAVRKYIANQRENHLHLSFQDEFRGFLRRHNIPFDERYVWD